MSRFELSLPEAIALLGLNDATGQRQSEFLNYALAGASMAELVLSGVLEDFARSHRDRIEGRPPVSIRDLMTRQNHMPD